jgi:hypothetical protein
MWSIAEMAVTCGEKAAPLGYWGSGSRSRQDSHLGMVYL